MARARTDPESLRGQNVISLPTAPAPEPGVPVEPRWTDYFPGKELAGLRRQARREWHVTIDRLRHAHVNIAELDQVVLEDYVVCRCRIRWLEAQLLRPTHNTDRGDVKDAAFSPLNQYRTQLKFYIDRLGLSPRSRQDLRQTKDEHEQGLNLD